MRLSYAEITKTRLVTDTCSTKADIWGNGSPILLRGLKTYRCELLHYQAGAAAGAAVPQNRMTIV